MKTSLIPTLVLSFLTAQSATAAVSGLDADGDGRSDIWQTFYGLEQLIPTADSDGDGATDGQEERAGTNPLDPLSVFGIERIVRNGAGTNVTVWVPGLGGKTYQLQRSDELTDENWENLGGSLQLEGKNVVTLVGSILPLEVRSFFRVMVSDIDADGDGLTAWEEAVIGTLDKAWDSNPLLRGNDRDVAVSWLRARGVDAPGFHGNLSEVDVAWLRNSTGSSGTPGLVVTAAGSGGEHVLTSWLLDSDSSNPVVGRSTQPADGHHARVVNLGPEIGLASAETKFASAVIREDGNLWVSSRALQTDGAFVHHGTLGYGANAGVTVQDYEISQRSIYEGVVLKNYIIVTPVIVGASTSGIRNLRLVTWVVSPSGELVGRDDYEVPQSVSQSTAMSLAHVDGIHFVLTYSGYGIDQAQSNLQFWVDDEGSVHSGGRSYGRSFDGSQEEVLMQTANAVAGFTSSGHVTANTDESGDFSLNVWERRSQGVLGYWAYRISDDSMDLAAGNGVAIDTPILTDSWRERMSSHDHAGQALAVGDFNGDGFDDTAIGAPDVDSGDYNNSGEVYVVHGHFDGFGEDIDQIWSQGTPGISGAHEAGDRFGAVLATGDFNGDGYDDLAVASPAEGVGNSVVNGGAVSILYGTLFGLSPAGNIIFTSEPLGADPVSGDRFGSALAVGDFDGDDIDDLAIGLPNWDHGMTQDAGMVIIVHGSASGLDLTDYRHWHQGLLGTDDSAEEQDRFGSVLAAGDFNGDHCDDLVVGVPYEDFDGTFDAGGVHIFYGAIGGWFESDRFIAQGDGGMQGEPGAEDRFGTSLAAGDFNGDSWDDLAIGVPGEDFGGLNDAGGVAITYGSSNGLLNFGNFLVGEDHSVGGTGNLPGSAEVGDNFGKTLCAGYLNNDEYCDLLIGAPFENLLEIEAAGAVTFLAGRANGLDGAESSYISEEPNAEAGSWFGGALAAGDFDGDGRTDFVMGIPLKDLGDDKINCGAVRVGSGSSVAGSTVTTLGATWYFREREHVRGIVSELGLESALGSGGGRVYVRGTGEPDVHMASVTKVMTLLLTVEAIEAGAVSLGDMVEISARAADTHGSEMDKRNPDGSSVTDENGPVPFLELGDRMPLRLLLHGMMMESGNKASVAIGEHVAAALTGDPHEFLSMMQDRADLFSPGAVYGHPAGGCVSDLQHQIDLLREGWGYLRFRYFMEVEEYGESQPELTLCGLDVNGAPKCGEPFSRFNTIGNYLGRLGSKGGNGGLWWNDGDLSGVDRPAASWSTSSAVGIAKRLDTELLMCLQQTGNRASDSGRLLDYGFRKIFTPDARGEKRFPEPGGVIGSEGPLRVQNFAIDRLAANRFVTAVIDDNEELVLTAWGVSFADGGFTGRGTASVEPALCDGFNDARPRRVDLTRMAANGRSLGDFCSAQLVGQHLEMKLWRIGERP